MAMFFSSTSPGVRKELQRYCELFSLAEKACKRAEFINLEGLLFPAINQLRNAGHHMVRASLADDEQQTLKEIQSAQGHVGRAIHEAYDAIALYYIAQCDQFTAEFKSIVIGEAYPDFLTEKRKLKNAKKALETTTRTSAIENDTGAKAALIDTLEDVYNNFENAREELNKQKRKERAVALISLITLLLTAFGIVMKFC